MSTTPEQESKWLPVARRITARWRIRHVSLESTIALELAVAVADERERCATIAETIVVPSKGHPQIDAPTPQDYKMAIVKRIREVA